jgi:hypothetical protein
MQCVLNPLVVMSEAEVHIQASIGRTSQSLQNQQYAEFRPDKNCQEVRTFRLLNTRHPAEQLFRLLRIVRRGP